jgi:hypothetical protein
MNSAAQDQTAFAVPDPGRCDRPALAAERPAPVCGTSSATPHVAAAAALVLSVARNLKEDDDGIVAFVSVGDICSARRFFTGPHRNCAEQSRLMRRYNAAEARRTPSLTEFKKNTARHR